MSDTPAFYAVTVTNSAPRDRGTALCWSRHFAVAKEANQHGKALVAAGRATLAFVVRIEGGVKTVLLSYVYPQSARKIITHWLELWDSFEEPK